MLSPCCCSVTCLLLRWAQRHSFAEAKSRFLPVHSLPCLPTLGRVAVFQGAPAIPSHSARCSLCTPRTRGHHQTQAASLRLAPSCPPFSFLSLSPPPSVVFDCKAHAGQKVLYSSATFPSPIYPSIIHLDRVFLSSPGCAHWKSSCLSLPSR